jgi:hypothetical protein
MILSYSSISFLFSSFGKQGTGVAYEEGDLTPSASRSKSDISQGGIVQWRG